MMVFKLATCSSKEATSPETNSDREISSAALTIHSLQFSNSRPKSLQDAIRFSRFSTLLQVFSPTYSHCDLKSFTSACNADCSAGFNLLRTSPVLVWTETNAFSAEDKASFVNTTPSSNNGMFSIFNSSFAEFSTLLINPLHSSNSVTNCSLWSSVSWSCWIFLEIFSLTFRSFSVNSQTRVLNASCIAWQLEGIIWLPASIDAISASHISTSHKSPCKLCSSDSTASNSSSLEILFSLNWASTKLRSAFPKSDSNCWAWVIASWSTLACFSILSRKFPHSVFSPSIWPVTTSSFPWFSLSHSAAISFPVNISSSNAAFFSRNSFFTPQQTFKASPNPSILWTDVGWIWLALSRASISQPFNSLMVTTNKTFFLSSSLPNLPCRRLLHPAFIFRDFQPCLSCNRKVSSRSLSGVAVILSSISSPLTMVASRSL